VSSIIVASIPVHGHITPMLAVAENFVTRGDDVRFVTGSRFADKVAATGATFVPLPAEADFDIEQFLQRFPERAKLKGLKAGTFDLENLLARPAKAQYETLMAALVAQSADAVLAEPLFLGAALLL
jgi:UDP:flavonoid glycosyltransferase YjiC (YdhE family)